MAEICRIMILEDEGVLGENIAEYFRGFGHEVALSCTVRDALDLLRRFPADIVVLDLDLAGGGAERVMAELLRVGIGAQRWVLITSRSAELREVALEVADRLLDKPFSLDSLGATVGGLLRACAPLSLAEDRP